jgi:hypothetical protein
MKKFDKKQLTAAEMIEIITRAPEEIECADAFHHFLEDLGTLIGDHFGGERGAVTRPSVQPEISIEYWCDNCEKVHHTLVNIIGLRAVADLAERLDAGSEVPYGECYCCGGFVYRKEVLAGDMEWMCSFEHNECVPDDGWVYRKYDTDIDWTVEPCCDEPYGCASCTS